MTAPKKEVLAIPVSRRVLSMLDSLKLRYQVSDYNELITWLAADALAFRMQFGYKDD